MNFPLLTTDNATCIMTSHCKQTTMVIKTKKTRITAHNLIMCGYTKVMRSFVDSLYNQQSACSHGCFRVDIYGYLDVQLHIYVKMILVHTQESLFCIKYVPIYVSKQFPHIWNIDLSKQTRIKYVKSIRRTIMFSYMAQICGSQYGGTDPPSPILGLMFYN